MKKDQRYLWENFPRYKSKIWTTEPSTWAFSGGLKTKQIFMRINIIAILLLIGCMQISAKSRSQTISLKTKAKALTQVLASIEKQTGYYIMYNSKIVRSAAPVTISASKMPLEAFLDEVLAPQNLHYTIDEKTILITRRKRSQSDDSNPTASLGQQREINGQVTDPEGLPAIGITVTVKGTQQSTVTDNNGHYQISAPTPESVLVFTGIGIATQEIPVGTSSTINVSLKASVQDLSDVVVVAYGTVDKGLHVGSSAQVGSEDFEDRPLTNVLNALVGSAPGIQGTLANGRPGEGAAIRVRGFGSISASNTPLYVVDGIPYDGGTANINPSDIESVSILKDAATTALYGSRGANGVIMITTKKGKIGQSKFTVNASAGLIRRGLPEYDRVDANQYYPLMWEALRNSLVNSGGVPMDIANSIASGQTTSYNGESYSGVYDLLGYNPFNVANDEIVGIDGRLNPSAQLLYPDDLDWAREIQRGGKRRQAYNINYSGATEKTDYFTSIGYTDDQGFLLKSDLKRISGRINVNTKATDWLRMGVNLSANHNISNYDVTSGNTTIVNPFYVSRHMGPIYPVYEHDPVTGAYVLDEFGNRIYDQGDTRAVWGGRHPIWENELNIQLAKRDAWGGRAYLEVDILPELTAKTNIGLNTQDVYEREYDTPIVGDGRPGGRSYHYYRRTQSYTWNQILEYNKSFGSHNLNILGGHENYAYIYNYLTANRRQQIVDGNIELPNFATIGGANSQEDQHTIESYFSRLSYNFDEKYVFSASLRRDGNSKFHPSFRWATFWSLGGAYNIDKEDFFNVPAFDLLKLRASYGVVGNDAGLGYYPFQSTYTLGRNNVSNPGFTQRTLPNDSLTWETGKNFDVGVDFAMFGNRLSGSIEYFDRKTDGLIFAVPVPLMNGGVVNISPYYHTIDRNIGNMYNRGFEASLTGVIVQNDKFRYSASLNMTHLKNQITKMPAGQPLIQNGTKGYSVGHSIYDYHIQDFYGVDPDNGDALYRTNIETANTKIIGADTVTHIRSEANLRYIGKTAIPDLYGSMFHDLSYKNFNLGIMFTWQLGGHVYDGRYAALMHSGTYGQAMHVDQLSDRWQKPGDQAKSPRLEAGQTTDLAGQSTRFLTSASYLNLNNITLGYTFPQHLLSSIGVNELYLFASGENLALLSARKGMDVVGNFNGTVSNSYTHNRVITFGTRIKF